MPFLNALKAAPKTIQAKLNTLLTEFNPRGNLAWIIIEGRDDFSFYLSAADRIAKDYHLSVHVLAAGNKKNVLYARQYLDHRYPQCPKLLFFTDKDHDDYLGLPDGTRTNGTLFVTQYYSVENYLVSEEAIRRIILDFWGIDNSCKFIELALQKFREFVQIYCEVTKEWMAWLIVARRLGEKPNNNNVRAKDILSVDSSFSCTVSCSEPYLEHLARKCGVKAAISHNEISTEVAKLCNQEVKFWLRGKQELELMIMFIEQIQAVISTANDCNKVRTKIHNSNVVELLASKLSCPPDLSVFLNEHFKAAMLPSLMKERT